ncbi:hypothetical protein BHE74_00010654 [Ensete ventricosum]|nr:hypothetical protein GW17_00032922 [Ensete ventricosum]RWW80983.1 hypothetical protein BHE74_00010654 [Ensete ventricosum]RZR97556.1 hypothetical protein BHM03_00026755 [Ensete ventricosum]
MSVVALRRQLSAPEGASITGGRCLCLQATPLWASTPCGLVAALACGRPCRGLATVGASAEGLAVAGLPPSSLPSLRKHSKNM